MMVHGCTLLLLRLNESGDHSDGEPDEFTAQPEYDADDGIWGMRWYSTEPVKLYELIGIRYCPKCGELLEP